MIRYICLSDLHLGDRDSLLNRFAGRDGDGLPLASPVLEQLVQCLRDLVSQQERPPTLIINGDLLEFAFGSVGNALTSFASAAALMLEPGSELFDEVLYLPGNHDHHAWELARETQYRADLRACGPGQDLPSLAHATRPFADAGVEAGLLNEVLAKLQPEGAEPRSAVGVRIVYPNLVLHQAGTDRAVLIHHGHFVESVYRLMSSGRRWLFPQRAPAQTVDEIEAENFAWIEFVWSLLGRSGEAGADVETLFEMLRYPQRVASYSADLAARMAPAIRMPFLPFIAARRMVLRIVFRRLAKGLSGERSRMAEVCSSEAMRGIEEYLFGPSFRQLHEELGEVPGDLTFLFGHTHKPFDKMMSSPDGGQVRVVNSGGWTIDTAVASEMFGASIVFIGDDLEVVPLRVFNDAPGGGPQALTLTGSGGGEPGRFAKWLDERIRADGASSWQTLIASVEKATRQRREHHRSRYGSPRPEAP